MYFKIVFIYSIFTFSFPFSVQIYTLYKGTPMDGPVLYLSSTTTSGSMPAQAQGEKMAIFGVQPLLTMAKMKSGVSAL